MAKALPPNHTLAEFVLWTGRHVPARQIAENHVGPFVEALAGKSVKEPGIQRLSYDAAIIEAVKSTTFIPLQEILANINHLVAPFDRFWIEGPPYIHEDVSPIDNPATKRMGFIIEKTSSGFLTKTLFEADILISLRQRFNWSPKLERRWLETATLMNGLLVGSLGTADSIDAQKIDLDIGLLEAGKRSQQRGSDLGELIDAAHIQNEFLLRLLMLLTSPKIPNNLLEIKNSQNTDIEGQRFLENKRGQRMGRYAKAPTISISIDLSADLKKALSRKSIKNVRKLLGWTDVRAHPRRYRNSDGTVRLKIDIKKHERRIPSDEDRRGQAVREITANKPGKFDEAVESVRHDPGWQTKRNPKLVS